VGRSYATDSRAAAREAATLALRGLADPPAALLVFSTAAHDLDAVLAVLENVAPGAQVCGCSAEGIITQGAADELDYALGVMAFGGG
jgi:hypothetical protein